MSRRIGMGANKAQDEKTKLENENKALTKKVEALEKEVETLNVEKEEALKEVGILKKKIKE